MRQSAVVAALLGAGSAFAAASCSLTKKCPKESPCCSQYGECGVGAYCLGGCDPRMSFSLDSCTPEPVCKSKTMTFDSKLSTIKDIGDYLGDPSTAEWMSQGEPAYYDGNVLLTMPKNSVGTVLATTEYMWYGNVKAKFKTSRGRGVVTAFILLSDVKDEIDYEFVGVDLGTAQTNWYFQGIPDYNNSGNITLSDTFDNYHVYEINWTPDMIQWLVDGKVGRTVYRKDHWNATSNQWSFPQTPARVQISIWPGGLASNAQGTIDWAGGLIDWNAPDIQKSGYFYATFESVTVDCYNATKGIGSSDGTSYTYDNIRGTNDTVVVGDKRTNLASLEGTGTDMDAGKPDTSSSASASGTATKSSDKPKNTQAQIPGGGSAPGQVPGGGSSDKGGSSGSSDGGSSGGSSSDGSDGGSSTPADTSGCSTTSFNQDCSSDSDTSGSKSGDKNAGSKAGVSALAMGLAGAALCLV
ncbi:glycoside hydrolase family 16 protein [Trichoderma citrinoviride]|uniref:Crh-like protein n=1 Tax=Trichoderma citrinoviride TaxID=58853 RepID=A0A2T4B6V1_9HYPO|nr:glycoside hydrolase family 16 protein [Trichoderma citrinoviride]PTB65054.1 glycoside hydrolase family 16 protein [Trichoderma citrinoviride]